MGWSGGGEVGIWSGLETPRVMSATARTGNVYTQLTFICGDGLCAGRKQVR